jgi:lysine 2,3-aminomutase
MLSTDQRQSHKPPADPVTFAHRDIRGGEFWRSIPAYAQVDEATFLDHIWQGRQSIKTPDELLETITDLVPASFIDDAREGFRRAPMAVRVSPYLIASIDWNDPYGDPIRRQFIPVASRALADHPRLTLDSLHEQDDSPVPGLIHRYVDKALFLPLNTCPVYCRFCTRSYAIGPDTEEVDHKARLAKTPKDWQDAFDYIASRPELEDIVISGGDTYQLAPKMLALIGDALLAIPHVRRLRFATKGPAVMPMKILTDHAWTDALTAVVERGRKLGKEVVVHTHFNSPREISSITQRAMNLLFERGIYVRNQSGSSTSTSIRITCTCTISCAGSKSCARRFRPPSISRRTCAARPPGSIRRCSFVTRRAAAASATFTASSITIAKMGSRSTRHPA